MRILFVVPPVFEGPGARSQPVAFTPLGFLSLAAVAERLGHSVEILDFNILLIHAGLRWDHDDPAPGVDEILKRRADVVGFTTMSGTYPLTLRMATALRRRSDVPILLGGPQASTVDVDTLRAFPAVTAIVRGEAETSLPMLVAWLSGGCAAEQVFGLTFRRGDEVVRNPEPPLIADLDELPKPAWHLYPVKKVVPLPVDVGRGCPFECTFCTTNLFFRRKFRMKSPGRLLAECEELMRMTGERRFFFVHDLFTVNRRMVGEICDAFLRADLGFTWRASARVDLVDEELLTLMLSAGCDNMFFGIESGSARRQRSMKKRIDVDEVVPKLKTAVRLGIEPTASFIIGFPDENLDELLDSARMVVELVKAGVRDVFIHNMLPLPGAELTEQHRHELVLEDRPAPLLRLPRADWELVKRHPEVFSSFYVFPRRGPWALRQLMMRSADLVRLAYRQKNTPASRPLPQPAVKAAHTFRHPAATRPARSLPLVRVTTD